MGLRSAIKLITNLTSRYDKLNAAATIFVGKAKEGIVEADALEKEWLAVKRQIAEFIATPGGSPRRAGTESGRAASADPNATPTDPTLINNQEPSSSRGSQVLPPPFGLTGGERNYPGGVGPSVTTLPGRPGLFGDTYSPEQLNRTGRRFDPVGGGGNAFAAQIADFASLIEFTYGPNNFFAQVIRSQIPYLTSGAKSPAEVRLFLEAAFTPFVAGIQAELQDPSASSQMRGVAGEMLRFIAGGNVGGVQDFPTLTVGPGSVRLPTTPVPAPTTTTASIGAIATSVTGLAATITHQEQAQGDRIIASIGLAATQMHAVVGAQASTLHTIQENNARANRDLAEQFQRIQGWQRHAEDEYLRPAQENMVRANRALAEGFSELGRNQLSPQALRDELERLNISGRLGAS